MNGTLTALLLTLIAGAATGIGGALVLFKKKLSSNMLAASLGLSAGVMIFISLTELFPEAQAEIAALGSIKYGKLFTLLAFFGGMGIIMLIDFLVPEYENPHEASELSLNGDEKTLHRLGVMSALAIAIHNFPEGIATSELLTIRKWVQASPLRYPSTTSRKESLLPSLYIMQQKAKEKLSSMPSYQDSASLSEHCSA